MLAKHFIVRWKDTTKELSQIILVIVKVEYKFECLQK